MVESFKFPAHDAADFSLVYGFAVTRCLIGRRDSASALNILETNKWTSRGLTLVTSDLVTSWPCDLWPSDLVTLWPKGLTFQVAGTPPSGRRAPSQI